MAEKRVFEIAKQHGLSSKEVVSRLKEAGLDASNAASVVDADAADKALSNGGSATPSPKSAPSKRAQKAAEEKAAAEAEKAAAEAAQNGVTDPAAVPQAPPGAGPPGPPPAGQPVPGPAGP